MSEKNSKRRVPIRINEENAAKLEEMATRYGMTMNSLVSYILGQWLDNNYDLKQYAREKMVDAMADKLEPGLTEMFSNPQFLMMIKDMINEAPENNEKA